MNSTTNAEILQAALDYLSLGFSVIPVHSVKDGRCTCERVTCSSPGKHPCVETWRDYQQRRPTEADIRKWFERWPWANVAIITGSISGLLVLDIDGPDGVESIGENPLPHTAIAETGGGGWHYLFKYPEGETIGNKTGILPGVDIRAEGGYIVAPPSVHKSGKLYEWYCEPGEMGGADGTC